MTTPIVSGQLATRLIRLQFGQETAWGAGVPATSIPMGISPVPTLTPVIKNTNFDQQLGSLEPSFLTAQMELGGGFDYKGEASYEDILYLLSAAYGLPTPTGNGATKNISAVSQSATKTITNISLASPCVVTAVAHGLSNGDTVVISGTNSTPVIDGTWVVSAVATDTFQIANNTTGTGSAGSVKTPSVVQTSTAHGLASGATVIIAGSNSTPVVDGEWVINVHDTTHFAIAAWCTVAGTTAGTVANPATWTFTPPTISAWTPLSLTMELGNTAGHAASLSGCLLQTWNLTSTYQKEVTFTAKGFGKTFTGDTSLTPALSFRPMTPILHAQSAVAIDGATVTPGTTPFPGTVVSWQIDGDTGLKPIFAAGSYAPVDFVYSKQTTKIKFGLLFNSQFSTFFKNYFAVGKPAVVQILAETGSNSFEFDFSGTVDTDPVLWGDSQGAQMLEIELDALHDSGLNNVAKAVVCNSVAALP